MATMEFDSTGVERVSFEPLPVGDYQAIIADSTWKHPKGGFGQPDTTRPAYLELKVTIIDGEYKGRFVIDRLNLNNDNPMTKKIAKSHFAGLLESVGLVRINDTSEVHNKPMIARLGVKAGEGQYGPSNDVKGYKAIVANTNTPAPAPKQEAQTTTTTQKPWG